jgi:hypothetical protein
MKHLSQDSWGSDRDSNQKLVVAQLVKKLSAFLKVHYSVHEGPQRLRAHHHQLRFWIAAHWPVRHDMLDHQIL